MNQVYNMSILRTAFKVSSPKQMTWISETPLDLGHASCHTYCYKIRHQRDNRNLVVTTNSTSTEK